jgi:glycosyltransferase involved in cell wall biosynthesis
MIRYSVVIPTPNQSRELALCLKHLSGLNFDQGLFQVSVIVNGSTDDAKEISISLKNRVSNLHYHFCSEPGLMAARHMGRNMHRVTFCAIWMTIRRLQRIS